MKMDFALNVILIKWLPQIFAQDTATMLSLHLQESI